MSTHVIYQLRRTDDECEILFVCMTNAQWAHKSSTQ